MCCASRRPCSPQRLRCVLVHWPRVWFCSRGMATKAHPAGAQRVHSVPASTRWPRAAHSTKEKTRRRTHARTARTEEADPPVRENQTQGDEASAEGHGQSDTPAAAARMAMVCRATRRAASNELPAARRAPAARVGLHQTLATSRETVHTIQMLWHERTPVPTTDPRGVGRPHCHALGRRNSRDTGPRAAARPEPLLVPRNTASKRAGAQPRPNGRERSADTRSCERAASGTLPIHRSDQARRPRNGAKQECEHSWRETGQRHS